MKRLIVAWVGMFVVVCVPVSSGATIIFQDGFEGGTPGQWPPGWSTDLVEGGVTALVDHTVYSEGTKSLHVSDSGSSDDLTITALLWDDTLNVVTLDYDMMSSNDSYEGAFVGFQGDGGYQYFATFSNGFANSLAGYIGVQSNIGNWIKPDLLPYEVHTWYHVHHEVDFFAKRISFQVWEKEHPSNGNSWSEVIPAYDQTLFDSIIVKTSTSQGADCHIDAIVATTSQVPEPSTLIIWSLLGGLATGLGWWRKRRGA